MDQWTAGPTDGTTKRGVESHGMHASHATSKKVSSRRRRRQAEEVEEGAEEEEDDEERGEQGRGRIIKDHRIKM